MINEQLQAMRQKRIRLLRNILRRYVTQPPQSEVEIKHQQATQNELVKLEKQEDYNDKQD